MVKMTMMIIMMIMIINKKINCCVEYGCSINVLTRFVSNQDNCKRILPSQPFYTEQTTSNLDSLIKNMNTGSVCLRIDVLKVIVLDSKHHGFFAVCFTINIVVITMTNQILGLI